MSVLGIALVGLLAQVGAPAAVAAATPPAPAPTHGTPVNAVPRAGTPNITDGSVRALAQVGDTIVAGGTFTSATSATGATTYALPYAIAFDATTGAVNTAFQPKVDGAVFAVEPGPTPGTVYLGGQFNNVNGIKAKGLALFDVATGARLTAFKSIPMNGFVETLKLTGSRLFVGGTFTTLNGIAHGGIGAVNATTAAVDPFVNSSVTEHHNYGVRPNSANGAVDVEQLDVSADGRYLIAIGNFRFVDGLPRDQIAMFDLAGTTAVVRADWQTHRYEAGCYNGAFDSYMRGVSFSPDGSYFVVAATGGGTDGLCDAAARFETTAAGTDVRETWSNFSGGDTVWAVAVTGAAVYIGGHQRWMNNVNGNDYPGPGAVPRPGLTALDPATGATLAWNPGRNPRGSAVYDLLATPAGLWLGSDTDYIGDRDYKRGKVAFFPLAGGVAKASDATQSLPGGIYLGAATSTPNSPVLYRVNAGGPEVQSLDSGPDWAADADADGPYRNSGSSTAGFGGGETVDGTVPAGTPIGVFDDERWDPGSANDGGEMQWSFPVPSGTQVDVRLYFANRCGCTSSPGQRVFDVSVGGATVLSNFDIVAAVGDQKGTVQSFPVTSTGTVTIDFTHVVENPLLSAIEIVRAGATVPPASGGTLSVRAYDGTTAGPSTPVGSPLDWSTVRGSTLAGGQLFYGKTDGLLYRRSFDGTTFGTETLIDPYNDPKWSTVDTGSGQTFRGTRPDFHGAEIQNLTSLFYDGGRLYYTLGGQSGLYFRRFSTDSGVLSGTRSQVAGVTMPAVRGGAFVTGGQLYYATGEGNLNRVGFDAGQLTGSPTVVSGPGADGVDWRAKALFLGKAPRVNQAPTATISSSCSGLSCTFTGSGTDPDGSVASYAWTFGDGGTAATANATHTYPAPDTYSVTLTVTDNEGLTGTATKQVTVQAPPTSSVAFRAATGKTATAASTTITVPAATQAGDVMLLAVSAGQTVTPTVPNGWSAVTSPPVAAKELTTVVYSRVAGAGDAGSTLSVGVGVSTKLSVQIAVYSGTRTTSPVSAVTTASDVVAATDHVAPAVNVADAGSWVVRFWADKSSATTSWTTPSAARNTQIGTGSGFVSATIADTGAAVPAGTTPAVTATTNDATVKATMVSVVLAPAP